MKKDKIGLKIISAKELQLCCLISVGNRSNTVRLWRDLVRFKRDLVYDGLRGLHSPVTMFRFMRAQPEAGKLVE